MSNSNEPKQEDERPIFDPSQSKPVRTGKSSSSPSKGTTPPPVTSPGLSTSRPSFVPSGNNMVSPQPAQPAARPPLQMSKLPSQPSTGTLSSSTQPQQPLTPTDTTLVIKPKPPVDSRRLFVKIRARGQKAADAVLVEMPGDQPLSGLLNDLALLMNITAIQGVTLETTTGPQFIATTHSLASQGVYNQALLTLSS